MRRHEPRPFTADDVATLKHLYAEGHSHRRIGIQMGRHTITVIRWTTRLGLARSEDQCQSANPGGPATRVSTEGVMSIRRLLLEGLTAQEIAHQLGYTDKTVHKYRCRLGLPVPVRPDPAPRPRTRPAERGPGPHPPLVLYREPKMLPSEPTPALPGTEEKIAVLSARFERRERLHHPCDAIFA